MWPPPVPEGAKGVPTPCARCGVAALHIEARLTALLGDAETDLEGPRPQVAVRESVWLVCRSCGAEALGRVEGGDVFFRPEDLTWGRRAR